MWYLFGQHGENRKMKAIERMQNHDIKRFKFNLSEFELKQIMQIVN